MDVAVGPMQMQLLQQRLLGVLDLVGRPVQRGLGACQDGYAQQDQDGCLHPPRISYQ